MKGDHFVSIPGMNSSYLTIVYVSPTRSDSKREGRVLQKGKTKHNYLANVGEIARYEVTGIFCHGTSHPEETVPGGGGWIRKTGQRRKGNEEIVGEGRREEERGGETKDDEKSQFCARNERFVCCPVGEI
ncbi:hypothetical protein RUM44_009348 [Polyplax serrata]|uniref:Uncharacterized protein n=1 Tax=Polyplax serrata TaxID=468196 RepID=A0ABR1AT23_POLSC